MYNNFYDTSEEKRTITTSNTVEVLRVLAKVADINVPAKNTPYCWISEEGVNSDVSLGDGSRVNAWNPLTREIDSYRLEAAAELSIIRNNGKWVVGVFDNMEFIPVYSHIDRKIAEAVYSLYKNND